MDTSMGQQAKVLRLRPAVWTGLIAGTVFIILEMIMVPLFLGGSAWAPSRMIAAIVLWKDVLPPPATFDAGVFVTSMVVHYVLSIIFASVIAIATFRFPMGIALLGGLLGGLVLYLVNFYLWTAVFDWFAMARNWVSIFAHLVFGGVVTWVYKTLQQRSEPSSAVGGTASEAT